MKFILLHLSENAPILFNIGHIITVQPENNSKSGSTNTIITTTFDGEQDCYYYYSVIENFEDIVRWINNGC